MSALGGSIASRVLVSVASVAISSALIWYIGSGAFSEQLKGGVGEVVERGRTRELASEIQRSQGLPREQAIEVARERIEAEEAVPASSGAKEGPSVDETRRSLLGNLASLLGTVAAALWSLIAGPVIAASSLAAGLLAVRTWHRRARREYVRLLLRPYRVEEASPGRVQRLYEGWHQAVLGRWWERLLIGQPSMAVELSAIPDQGGGVLLRYTLVAERRHLDAITSRLSGTYQHMEVEEASGEPPWCGQIIRLKKRFRFAPKRLMTREGERNPIAPGEAMIDTLVTQLEKLRSPATVQITLVPAPALFDVWLRALIQTSEAARTEADPTGRSELDEREHEGAAESLAYRAPFFGDIRIAADELAVAKALAATIRGGTRGENHLVERRQLVRRGLYANRIRAGVANPLPSFRVGVYSSAELAGLWHMPNSHLVEAPVERHSTPRVAAPPQVPSVSSELALGRDCAGRWIGLHDEDRFHNMAFVGAQGTGKTSGMLAWARAPLASREHAVIVLDPKEDLALKALSIVPEWRRAHYVDFGRPEAGFDIFHRPPGTSVDSVVDGLIAGFTETTRTEEGQSQVLISSQRFFQAAGVATLLCYAQPSLWDLWYLLLPTEGGEREREKVCAELLRHPEYAAARLFFAEQWPEQMRVARSSFAAKLDPPVNKIQSVLNSPALDRVLRHPYKIDIDRVIEEREVLVVNGAVGEVGEENSRTALLWLLTMIHRALQRQQAKPESERAKVALVLDEARMVATPTLERMLSMDRSAGIEVASAWQFSEQIRARDVRAGMLALHRNLAVFACGQADARELSDLFSISHDDSLSGDPAERERHPYAPDALTNMPVHHAAAKLLVRGSKVAPFTYETPAMSEEEDRIERHLARQRAEGGRYPEAWGVPSGFESEVGSALASDLWADAAVATPSSVATTNGGEPSEGGNGDRPGAPVPDSSGNGHRPGEADEAVAPVAAAPEPASPSTVDRPAAESNGSSGTASEPRAQRPPKVSATERGSDLAEVAPLGSPTGCGVSELLTDLDRLEEAGRISFEEPPAEREPIRLDRFGYELLAGLYELRFLSVGQMRARYLTEKQLRTAQRRLGALYRAGLVRRIRFSVPASRGSKPTVYAITRDGFRASQEQSSPQGGTYIPRAAVFRESEAENPRVILHDLHAASWLFALEDLAPDVIRDWYGPARGRLECPRRREDDGYRPISAREVSGLGRGQGLADLRPEGFDTIVPDITIEVEAGGRENDLLLELDRSRRGVKENNRRKLVRYDALLCGWWRALSRYSERGKPPVVVFACMSEEQARSFVEVADRLLVGAVHREGRARSEWYYPGRWFTFFSVARDVHQRTTRAYQVPKLPPEVRKEIARNAIERRAVREVEPIQTAFIPSRLLRNPAR